MPAPADPQVSSGASISGPNARNLAALEAVKFAASSTAENLTKRGPEHAVAGATFWEAAEPPPGMKKFRKKMGLSSKKTHTQPYLFADIVLGLSS